MSYELYSLRELIENVGEPRTAEVLRRFTCTKDPDLELFLHRNAVMMEKKALSRTYVALTDDDRVVGYFSVGMKCMGVPDDVPISGSLRKKLNVNGETGVAQMYLLGQLARSDDSEVGIGAKLLDDALDIIHRAFIAVGCRAVRVDCKTDLLGYYLDHGFTFINRNPDDDLNRLVTIIE